MNDATSSSFHFETANSSEATPRVAYFLRGDIGKYPPCITQLEDLALLGLRVHAFVSTCPNHLRDHLESIGVGVTQLGHSRTLPSAAGAIESILKFRYKVSNLRAVTNSQPDIIWHGSADTAIALNRMFGSVPQVATCLELYDTYPHYRAGLKKCLPHMAAVVASEETRASIMQVWYGLDRQPYVIPNRARTVPVDGGGANTPPELNEIINAVASSKSILYQGLISPDRDLTPLATAVTNGSHDWELFLMGPIHRNSWEGLGLSSDRVHYLGSLPAPFHLQVTSAARVGVAYYQPRSMNNLFCAPNKIYEYAGAGVPILGNRIPGLVSTVERFSAGICVDFHDVRGLRSALTQLDSAWSSYSDGATRMYASAATLPITRRIVQELTAR